MTVCADSLAQERQCVTLAARNCSSYRWPPAGARAFDSATTSGRDSSPPQNERTAIPYHVRSFTRARRHCVALRGAQTALLTSPPRPILNPPLAQFHPRNTPCARKRAVQHDQRELQSSSLPLAQPHPRNTPVRDASATRNCTSYRWPSAGAFASDSATTAGSEFIPSIKRPQSPTACAASLAQDALRAQACRSTPSTRAAVQLVTVCADSFAQERQCVTLPRRAIALRTAGLRPAPLHLTLQPRQGGDSSPPKKDRHDSPQLAQPHPRDMLCARKRAVQPHQRELQFSSLPFAPIHSRNTPLRRCRLRAELTVRPA